MNIALSKKIFDLIVNEFVKQGTPEFYRKLKPNYITEMSNGILDAIEPTIEEYIINLSNIKADTLITLNSITLKSESKEMDIPIGMASAIGSTK